MFNLKNYLSIDFEMKLIKIRGGIPNLSLLNAPH